MMTAGAVLTVAGDSIGTQLGDVMRGGLTVSREQAFDVTAMTRGFSQLSMAALYAIAPVLLATLVAALAAPLAIGGWAPSGKPITPDFSRLSPLAGVKRMFSLRSWVELGKALAKFAVVGIVAAVV